MKIKKNISKQNGRQIHLPMQVGKSAQEAKVGDLKSNDQQNQIFREAHRMKIENQDIVGDKWI